MNRTVVDEKPDLFSNNEKRAVKVNPAFGFILKFIEDESLGCFYTHENNRRLDRSKFVCTKDDLMKLKKNVDNLTSSVRVVEED